jgi:hypothetical protein
MLRSKEGGVGSREAIDGLPVADVASSRIRSSGCRIGDQGEEAEVLARGWLAAAGSRRGFVRSSAEGGTTGQRNAGRHLAAARGQVHPQIIPSRGHAGKSRSLGNGTAGPGKRNGPLYRLDRRWEESGRGRPDRTTSSRSVGRFLTVE